jgi:hypothetical protein
MKKIVLLTMVLLLALNFATFLIGATYLGGDAFNGKYENGHYYLGSHGRFIETSGDIFRYSQWHIRSLFITMPLLLLFIWLVGVNLGKKKAPSK